MSDVLAMLSPLAGTPGLQPSPPTGPAPSGAANSDFSKMLASMASEAANTIAQGEAVSMAGMQGKASVQQVVEAVMQAEQTLHTMVAIRDKVIGAYLDISRMQI